MWETQWIRSSGWLATVALLLVGVIPSLAQDIGAPADSAGIEAIPDEDVPYGVAAGYIVGHKLLQEGDYEAALPYLHMAYRAQPDVLDIAMDFQAALSAQGYHRDALEVVDHMVALFPDSLSIRAQRANLHLKAGDPASALTDLRELRQRGYVTFAIIDAEASILAGDGKIDQALDVYREGLQLVPDDGPDLYLGMAGVLQRSEQVDRIPALMGEALRQYPDSPRLWMIKIRVLAALGEDQTALTTAQKADTHFAGLAISAATLDTLQIHPGADDRSELSDLPVDSFVVELADFYAQRRDLNKAVGVLQPLADAGMLQLSPSLWLGRLLLGTGRSEEGGAVVTEILRRWPEAGRGWFLKAKMAEEDGQWADALLAFARAVDLEPRDPEIRLGYVRAMLVAWEDDLAAQDPDGAQRQHRADFRRHLLVAADLVPVQDSEGHLILGYGFKAIGDFERATGNFKLAADNSELRLNALLQKSLCHDLQGQDAEARRDLETLHREYPRHPDVANSLGYFLAEKGVDLELAAELVTMALEAEPGNAAFLDSMGWIHYRRGDLEQALDYLIQAVNVLPDDPVILEHLGLVLTGQGKKAEALDVLQRALLRGGDRERLQKAISDLESGSDER